MKQKKFFWTLAAASILAFLVGCSSTPASTSSSSSAVSSAVSSSAASSSSAAFVPVIAYTNDFEIQTGSFYVARGIPLAGNNTIVTNASNSCVEIHCSSTNLYGDNSAEIQWTLLNQTPMTGENFQIDFDIYVPSASRSNLTGVQWAFYDTINTSYTPIYSVYYVNSVVADTWSHIRGYVSTTATNGGVSYSGFTANGGTGSDPGSWTFDKVRIQFKSTAANQDILFYVDNLRVASIF